MNFFTPVTKYQKDFTNSHQRISRKRHPFNDKRLDSIHIELQEQIQKEEKITIHQISEDISQAARFYRFYSNKKVSPEELIKMNTTIKPDILKGKRVLCIGDSTVFNMRKQQNSLIGKGFGVLQDGKTPGFHAHASLALDADDGGVIGLSDIVLWNRPADRVNFAFKTKEQKESYKWYLGANNSHEVLNTAESVNYVFDREADNFNLFVHLKRELQSNFTIRLKQDRMVKFGEEKYRISQYIQTQNPALVYQTKLDALNHYSKTDGKRKKRKARIAELELRFANVEVLAPAWMNSDESLHMAVVEVQEITANLPPEEAPLHWLLWTSIHLKDPSDALQIVKWYLLRWTIEQLFRTMKSKGFNQQTTQLGSVDSILKQTITTFKAATQVMQLVQARNQENAPDIEILFDQTEQQVLKKVNEGLQGETEKLKNPFPPTQLNYAAWIIARLGGWKGYSSQKPPGPITMKLGLSKFYNILEGYLLFNST